MSFVFLQLIIIASFLSYVKSHDATTIHLTRKEVPFEIKKIIIKPPADVNTEMKQIIVQLKFKKRFGNIKIFFNRRGRGCGLKVWSDYEQRYDEHKKEYIPYYSPTIQTHNIFADRSKEYELNVLALGWVGGNISPIYREEGMEVCIGYNMPFKAIFIIVKKQFKKSII